MPSVRDSRTSTNGTCSIPPGPNGELLVAVWDGQAQPAPSGWQLVAQTLSFNSSPLYYQHIAVRKRTGLEGSSLSVAGGVDNFWIGAIEGVDADNPVLALATLAEQSSGTGGGSYQFASPQADNTVAGGLFIWPVNIYFGRITNLNAPAGWTRVLNGPYQYVFWNASDAATTGLKGPYSSTETNGQTAGEKYSTALLILRPAASGATLTLTNGVLRAKGQPLILPYVLLPANGTLRAKGQPVALPATLTLNSGILRARGQTLTVGATHLLQAASSALRVLGQGVSLAQTHLLVPASGTLRAQGTVLAVGQTHPLAPTAAPLRTRGQTLSLAQTHLLIPTASPLRLAGTSLSLPQPGVLLPQSAPLRVRGEALAVGQTHLLAPASAPLRAHGQAIAVASGNTLVLAEGVLHARGQPFSLGVTLRLAGSALRLRGAPSALSSVSLLGLAGGRLRLRGTALSVYGSRLEGMRFSARLATPDRTAQVISPVHGARVIH